MNVVHEDYSVHENYDIANATLLLTGALKWIIVQKKQTNLCANKRTKLIQINVILLLICVNVKNCFNTACVKGVH